MQEHRMLDGFFCQAALLSLGALVVAVHNVIGLRVAAPQRESAQHVIAASGAQLRDSIAACNIAAILVTHL